MPASEKSAVRRLTLRLAGVSMLLALTLAGAVAICLLWAVAKIDNSALQDQRTAIENALQYQVRRVGVEQDSSAAWDEAAVKVRANNQSWIAENLAEWMSSFFDHDRVYVIAPDDKIVRAASDGNFAGQTIEPSDVRTVQNEVYQLRQAISARTFGLENAAPVVRGMGSASTERLPQGEIVIVSVRPIVPTSDRVGLLPGQVFLIASVKAIDQAMLDDIADQLGVRDLTWVPYPIGDATLVVRDGEGLTLGYVGWSPEHPAAALLIETAPASISLFLVGLAALVGLLTWVRTASVKLEATRAQATYFALHDPLTGAANRILFDRKLTEALGYQHLAEVRVLIIAIDLDHFKDVNDTLGHAAGDRLLTEVAKRIIFELPEEATLGRLGGDEFAIVQPGIVGEGQALWITNRLLGALQKPVMWDGHELVVSFSFGVSLEDPASTGAEEMMRRADVALYHAKASGRNQLQFYHPALDQARREDRELETDLRNALSSTGELTLLYQPYYSSKSGAIAGAEALVRWNHPERGLLSPDRFIRLAEERKLIGPLGLWVLEQACSTAIETGIPSVAVNVSPVQFSDPLFADQVLAVIERLGLHPARLEIEITEGLLLRNSSQVQSTLARLRNSGIGVALDDFGTGYSSISYLRSYAVDKLKIDRSFIKLVAEDRATTKIVRSMVDVAEALGMKVTAEGVEDEAQRRTLSKLGCTYLQGFLLSHPVRSEDLAQMVARDGTGEVVRLFGSDGS